MLGEWGDLRRGGRTIGVGIASPVEVLAYRTLWNAYVLDTACGLYVQAWALEQMAASPSYAVPTSIDTSSTGVPCASRFAARITAPLVDVSHIRLSLSADPAALLRSIAGAARSQADLLVANWNEFAGLSDAQILLQASSILTTYQDAVLQCGQRIRPTLAIVSPAIASALDRWPTVSAQDAVVAPIEASGILAQGVLQLFGIAADGAIDAYQTTADYAKRIVQAVTSPWLWVPVAVVAVVVAGAIVWHEVPHPTRAAA